MTLAREDGRQVEAHKVILATLRRAITYSSTDVPQSFFEKIKPPPVLPISAGRVLKYHPPANQSIQELNKYAVCPSGPSMDGRARLDGRLWKIARLKPVFL